MYQHVFVMRLYVRPAGGDAPMPRQVCDSQKKLQAETITALEGDEEQEQQERHPSFLLLSVLAEWSCGKES